MESHDEFFKFHRRSCIFYRDSLNSECFVRLADFPSDHWPVVASTRFAHSCEESDTISG